MTSPADRFIDVNGIRLWVRERGTGSALVLLHGWTLDLRMWEPQLAALSGSRRVIAFDRRGCGKSSGTADLARETDDLSALLDSLHIDRAVLCGASQGGRVALRFALAHPDRVHGLILTGTSLDGMPEPESDPGHIPLTEYAALAQQGRLDEMHARWLRHPLMRIPDGDAALRRQLEAMVADYRGEDLLAPPSPGGVDTSGRLGEIVPPALIVTGALETSHRKAIAARLQRELPNAQAIEIANSGHLVNLIAPVSFDEAINLWDRR